jgi:hypothetical protein
VSANGFVINVMNTNGSDAGSGVYFPPFSSINPAPSSLTPGFGYGVAPGSGTCTASNMNVSVVATSTGTALGTTTMTLYHGSGSATPTASTLTCSTASVGGTAGNTGTCSDHTHTVSITGGDTLSLHFTEANGASAAAAYMAVSFTCH